MDDISKIIEAVDSPWAFLTLLTLGIGILVRQYAGKIIDLLIVNATKTEEIQEQIVTNHGSKNIGDAIDRLYSKLDRVEGNQDADRALISTLARDQERHIAECREYHNPGRFITKETPDGTGQ